MKMCMRCGAKGKTWWWHVVIRKGMRLDEDHMDQEFDLCPECTSAVLDQLSVVISNETWPGDKEPQCTP